MRLNTVAGLLITLIVSGCAVAQSSKPSDEHTGHHPAGSAAGPVMATQPSSTTGAVPGPDAFELQMKMMQEMHKKMQSAKAPGDRAALMEDHMNLMQTGMAMMGQMRDAGTGAAGGMSGMGGLGQAGMGMGMGMMQQGPQAKPGMHPGAGGPGVGGMMGMHMQMERRMAMIEQMMQMMVDRATAMPAK